MWNDDTVPVPQPIAADPPGVVPRPWLTQWWLDLAFLHWAVEPRRVAPLLPRGVVPDTLYGTTYVGLIAFRMHRIGWFGLRLVSLADSARHSRAESAPDCPFGSKWVAVVAGPVSYRVAGRVTG